MTEIAQRMRTAFLDGMASLANPRRIAAPPPGSPASDRAAIQRDMKAIGNDFRKAIQTEAQRAAARAK